ncbi:MAG: hypothetical protein GY765_12030 [bacterium]|nr:hypothetical protein [bacterium]
MTVKKKKIAFFIIYNVFIVAVVFLALEYICLILNKNSADGAQPYLFDKSRLQKKSGVRQVGGTTMLSFVDPHLGYSHDWAAKKNLR